MTRDQIRDAVTVAKPRLLPARFGGRCPWCDQPIEVGSMIAYSSDPRCRFVLHDPCHADAYIEATQGAAS